MTLVLEPIQTTVFCVVMLGWFVFAGIFIFRKKTPQAPEARSAPVSKIGIGLQMVAYAAVWSLQRRPLLSPIVPMGKPLEIVLAVLTIALSVGSVWMSMAAINTLGKQWSFKARLIEEHKLITTGPYSIVRHPIYSAMFGKMLATAMVVSHWIALPIAILFFAIGTAIRVRSEEKLLREAFGAEFEAYRQRVPAVIPFLKLG